MPEYNNPYGSFNPYQTGNAYQSYGVPSYRQNANAQFNQYAFVNGIEGAKAFQLQPNQSIMLMDSDNLLCYMKQANAMGQATLRYFKLIETTEEEIRGKTHPEPSYDFASKSEVEELSKRIDELTKRLERKPRPEVKEDK